MKTRIVFFNTADGTVKKPETICYIKDGFKTLKDAQDWCKTRNMNKVVPGMVCYGFYRDIRCEKK